MNETTQLQQDNAFISSKKRLLPIQTRTDVRYLTAEELEKSITDDDIKRGLNLAGAWRELNMTEDELFRKLDEIRHGSEPSQPLNDDSE